MSKEGHFEEKILYKTHQHWIVLVVKSVKLILTVALPISVLTFLVSSGSWGWTFVIFLMASFCITLYDHYLWHHSWMLIGNQKITLTVRNGIFSQYAMNIRYRNIRDCAVSKNNFFGYLLKYGTIFVRSSANEGDFQAHYVPKVGKIFAIINALSRYSDDERIRIHSLEELHSYHQNIEFGVGGQVSGSSMTLEEAKKILESLPGITSVIDISLDTRNYIKNHEELRNTGVIETLSRDNVLVFLHNHLFREAGADLTLKNGRGEVYFPGIPFPEIQGKKVISSSPSAKIHEYLLSFFPYSEPQDATVLVGWDK